MSALTLDDALNRNCCFCGKTLSSVKHWIDGKPVGPVCFESKIHSKVATSVAVILDQPDLFTMSYAELELKVIQWGEAKGIIQKSNNMAQAIKTLEEVGELLEAIHKGDIAAQKDAYGDILVTLIIGCATADFDLKECLHGAYEVIKNRTGKLDAAGVFVKDSAA